MIARVSGMRSEMGEGLGSSRPSPVLDHRKPGVGWLDGSSTLTRMINLRALDCGELARYRYKQKRGSSATAVSVVRQW